MPFHLPRSTCTPRALPENSTRLTPDHFALFPAIMEWLKLDPVPRPLVPRLHGGTLLFEGCMKIAKIAAWLRVQSSLRSATLVVESNDRDDCFGISVRSSDS